MIVVGLVACRGAGGGKDKKDSGDDGGGGDVTVEAKALVPKLDDLGFKVIEQGREPAVPTAIDSAAAIFRGKDLLQQIQVRIRVEPDEATAKKEYETFKTLLKNPPKEFLGIEAKFVDTEALKLGEQQVAYKTEQADVRGYSAWTDIYRTGRVVVLVQVVDNSADGQPLRQETASRVLQGLK